MRANLILVDIVCHGVPSPYIWRDYIAYLEKKQGDKICRVNFRDKEKFGWKAHKESFATKADSISSYSYTYLFYQHIMFRHSCSICPYTNTKRPSDITIADFWGWEKTDPNINKDDKGVSLVLVNTEKGRELIESAKERMVVIPARLENCLQPNLQHPSVIHAQRIDFERNYERKGFMYVMKRYGNIGWRYKAQKAKKTIKKFINRI